jgi:type IV pilus assembly protein PilB
MAKRSTSIVEGTSNTASLLAGILESTKTKLGELLVSTGDLTEAQLRHALAQQGTLQLPLGKVLRKLNYVSDERIRQALSVQLDVPYVDLEKMRIDPALSRIISRSYARRHLLLPIARIGRTLTVAMDDPTATAVIEELSRLTGYAITRVTASSQAIQRAFSRLYSDASEPIAAPGADLVTPVEAGLDTLAAPVVVDEQVSRRADELFRVILHRALESRASDIHIEMLHSGLLVRYRIDGVLRKPNLEEMQDALDDAMREIVSRVKILARLDIAERRRPQDGRFQVSVDRDDRKEHIDLRVSIVPSHSGESVVIRVLDRARGPRSLADLNLNEPVARRIDGLLKRATGIMLVTGPTGSGKSTTLYSCLMKLHHPGIRILTAEDPVEYVYDELSQSEVNAEIGNTFAHYLRAFLRHDPEVIMIGEIRDEDTAEMAFRAAQTGHLLLSTMHTNSAIETIPRLLDLKVDSSLIGSLLNGVISQRLLRKVCSECSVPYAPPPEEVAALFSSVPDDVTFAMGEGCEACGFTGFRGRMVVADLWVPDEQDVVLIMRQAPITELRRSAERTTISMAEDAHQHLRAGRTTITELLRVLPHPVIVDHRTRYSAAPADAASARSGQRESSTRK